VLTEDGFTPDDPLPLFLSGHADEHEERGSLLLLNASILVLVASLIGMAIILSFGNPAKVFADIKASLIDLSALQPDTVQSTPTIQSTADAKALPVTAGGALTRDDIATNFDTADQSQAGISEAPSGALLKEFQDWAAKEDARAQIETVRPAQDARAQVLQNAQARVLPIQKH
jgi:ABC-type molybdate transport system substrate-binding protein